MTGTCLGPPFVYLGDVYLGALVNDILPSLSACMRLISVGYLGGSA
jgi:hypothetical protein